MQKKNFEDYYIKGKEIKEGVFSTLYEGETKNKNKEKIAIKIISKSKIRDALRNLNFIVNDKDFEQYTKCFFNEINNMKILEGENKDNENAVKFYNYFDNKNEFIIVMELCDENILSYLSKNINKFNSKKNYEIINQLNKSFKIMAKNKFVYGRLKLENILLKYNKEKTKFIVKLKLSDNSDKMIQLYNIFSSKNNNRFYLNSPELIKRQNLSGKSDLWSLGVIIYILYFNDYPYKGNSEKELLEQINLGNNILKTTSNEDLNDLIRKLLVKNPQNRLSWDEYFNHPFFRKDFWSNYENKEKIGESGYAIIYKVTDKKTQEVRAIKVFDKNKVKSIFRRQNIRDPTEEEIKPYIKSFYNEINHMKMLSEGGNINTVKLIDYFDTKNEIGVVMELCDNNLLDFFIERMDSKNSKEIFNILVQLNNSLKLMHKNNLVHRALNLENILIKYKNKKEKTKYTVKLKLTEDCCLIKDLSKSHFNIKGNINFIAPEILKKEKNIEKCDLWSLGIIIYVLYFKNYPYVGNEKEILKDIKKKTLKKIDNWDLNNIIQNLLIEDPQKRFTWDQYFNYPAFRNISDYNNYYTIEKKIGDTKYATVYKGKDNNTNEIRAIKVFDKNKIRNNYKRKKFIEMSDLEMTKYIARFNNEINHLKMIDQEGNNNTVKFIESFNTDDNFAIVMELCDDNLLNLFTKRNEPFDSKTIKNILCYLNNSFKIMAKNKLVHMALNLENILVKYEDQRKTNYIVKLKLTDDSCLINELPKRPNYNRGEGFLNYIAPEILKNQKYDEKCDLWSLGIIIYLLYFKCYPYNGNNEKEILEQIKQKKEVIKTDNISLNDLIQKLLVEDPKYRLTWSQYFSHPFFMDKEIKSYKDCFKTLEIIGHSKYATIYKAKDLRTEELLAIKIFDKKKIQTEKSKKIYKEVSEEELKPYIKGFNNEVTYMKMISGNKNTVRFIQNFISNDEFVIAMELCDDSLLNVFAKSSSPYNSKEILNILTQLNNCFKLIDKNKLILRALNLDNILIKYEERNKCIYKLKLTDDSCLLSELKSHQLNIIQDNMIFVAPEILKKQEYNEKCDLWSLGVIIYTLAFKKYPYFGDNEIEILDEIKNNDLEKSHDNYLNNLIQRLLVEDPKKRMDWNQYFNHSFFK